GDSYDRRLGVVIYPSNLPLVRSIAVQDAVQKIVVGRADLTVRIFAARTQTGIEVVIQVSALLPGVLHLRNICTRKTCAALKPCSIEVGCGVLRRIGPLIRGGSVIVGRTCG